MGGEEGLEREEVVAFEDEIAVERGFLPPLQTGKFRVELQRVMRDRAMVILDRGFSLELKDRQWKVPPLRSPGFGGYS